MPHSLADAIFWAAVGCCAVAQWHILRGAVGAHAAPPGVRGVPATKRRLELAWAVVPAVGLALVLAATWRALHPRDAAGAGPLPAHTATAIAPTVGV